MKKLLTLCLLLFVFISCFGNAGVFRGILKIWQFNKKVTLASLSLHEIVLFVLVVWTSISSIAAGGVNWIISPARDHNDLFFHHLDLVRLFQRRRLTASPEHSGIAETTYENQKQQTESQQLFHTNTSMLKLTISQIIYHLPLAVIAGEKLFPEW